MKFDRSSGVLLHPTSLPGPYGIGDLGPQAFAWVDFLAETRTGLWQVLPLGPTGYGDSPYQCFSAFAGNTFLLSPDLLIQDGLLQVSDLEPMPVFKSNEVDYGPVIEWKNALLDRAYDRFSAKPRTSLKAAFEKFRQANLNWLEDYALFRAIKEAHGGVAWPQWDADLRSRKPEALAAAASRLAESVAKHRFGQFLFYKQWNDLRAYANRKGIKIIGDMPIFVAHDSAEVWATPEMFYINEKGQPTVVAGVPPDYYSSTGQLWGNPLYRWDAHQADNFAWWMKRMQAALGLFDIIRLDHFRGFAAYWEVAGKAKTAKRGRWVNAPGQELFATMQKTFGSLPIIAEDLGVITPDVEALRDGFDMPGMKIMVFAFSDDATNEFLPHNYRPNTVVYTSTHDNDTALGWYKRVPEKERDYARRYLARSGDDVSWDLIRTAWASVSVMALAAMQDLLSLDNTARMNYPSRLGGNWSWRMPEDALSESLKQRLLEQNVVYGRAIPLKPTKPAKK